MKGKAESILPTQHYSLQTETLTCSKKGLLFGKGLSLSQLGLVDVKLHYYGVKPETINTLLQPHYRANEARQP